MSSIESVRAKLLASMGRPSASAACTFDEFVAAVKQAEIPIESTDSSRQRVSVRYEDGSGAAILIRISLSTVRDVQTITIEDDVATFPARSFGDASRLVSDVNDSVAEDRDRVVSKLESSFCQIGSVFSHVSAGVVREQGGAFAVNVTGSVSFREREELVDDLEALFGVTLYNHYTLVDKFKELQLSSCGGALRNPRW